MGKVTVDAELVKCLVQEAENGGRLQFHFLKMLLGIQNKSLSTEISEKKQVN